MLKFEKVIKRLKTEAITLESNHILIVLTQKVRCNVDRTPGVRSLLSTSIQNWVFQELICDLSMFFMLSVLSEISSLHIIPQSDGEYIGISLLLSYKTFYNAFVSKYILKKKWSFRISAKK